MRPLKFRAWDNKNKKWLLGYELPNLGGFSLFGECMMFGEWERILNHFMHADNNPDDLMVDQSSGLKDKNGVEIFEGDIVEWPVYKGRVDRAVMEYRNRNGRLFTWPTINGSTEVIGNIHENPELLGGRGD